MSDTIASLNEYADEFGITEVLPLSSVRAGYLHVSLTAKSHEFLCHRRGECCGDTLYFFKER